MGSQNSLGRASPGRCKTQGKDLEADMGNGAGDPTTTFCLKGIGTRFTGED